MRRALSLALLLALAPEGAGAGGEADAAAAAIRGPGPGPGGAAAIPGGGRTPRAHDLHISYGNAAVEGATLVFRVRIFRDDLEAALTPLAAGRTVAMAPDPAVDSLFLAYAEDRLVVEVAGRRLTPRLLARGEDELDREPVWWYTIQFQAPAELTAFRLRNTLLLELFRDQRNIVKVVRFPDEKQLTFAFAAGEEVADVRF